MDGFPRHYSRRIRDGIFEFVRRVPSYVADLDRRQVVRISLKTRNEAEASIQARAMDSALDALWAELLAGHPVEATWIRHRAAMKVAQHLGFALRTVSRQKPEIAVSPP